MKRLFAILMLLLASFNEAHGAMPKTLMVDGTTYAPLMSQKNTNGWYAFLELTNLTFVTNIYEGSNIIVTNVTVNTTNITNSYTTNVFAAGTGAVSRLALFATTNSLTNSSVLETTTNLLVDKFLVSSNGLQSENAQGTNWVLNSPNYTKYKVLSGVSSNGHVDWLWYSYTNLNGAPAYQRGTNWSPQGTFDFRAWKTAIHADHVYDIRDYGAIGDGVNNDTPAVLAAYQAAVVSGGGVVFFPGPTNYWLFNLTVTNPSITLRGSGGFSTTADDDDGNYAHCRPWDTTQPIVTVGATGYNVRNARVEDMSFNAWLGTTNGAGCLRVANAWNCQVRDSAFYGGTNTVQFENVPGGTVALTHLRGCAVVEDGDRAIVLRRINSGGGWLTSCYLSDCHVWGSSQGYAIEVENYHLQLVNTYVDAHAGHGVLANNGMIWGWHAVLDPNFTATNSSGVYTQEIIRVVNDNDHDPARVLIGDVSAPGVLRYDDGTTQATEPNMTASQARFMGKYLSDTYLTRSTINVGYKLYFTDDSDPFATNIFAWMYPGELQLKSYGKPITIFPGLRLASTNDNMVDGDKLLTLQLERPWYIQQRGRTNSAALDIRTDAGTTGFGFSGPAGSNSLSGVVSDTEGNRYALAVDDGGTFIVGGTSGDRPLTAYAMKTNGLVGVLARNLTVTAGTSLKSTDGCLVVDDNGTVLGSLLVGGNATITNSLTVVGPQTNVSDVFVNGHNATPAMVLSANSVAGGAYIAAIGTNQNVRLVPTGSGFVHAGGVLKADSTIYNEGSYAVLDTRFVTGTNATNWARGNIVPASASDGDTLMWLSGCWSAIPGTSYTYPLYTDFVGPKLGIYTASATSSGAVTSNDWRLFNTKVGGSGADLYISIWDGPNNLDKSIIRQTADGRQIYIGGAPSANANTILNLSGDLEVASVYISATIQANDYNGFWVHPVFDPVGSFKSGLTTNIVSPGLTLFTASGLIWDYATNSITETDPVFGVSVASGISSGLTNYWHNKVIGTSGYIPIFDTSRSVGNSLMQVDGTTLGLNYDVVQCNIIEGFADISTYGDIYTIDGGVIQGVFQANDGTAGATRYVTNVYSITQQKDVTGFVTNVIANTEILQFKNGLLVTP